VKSSVAAVVLILPSSDWNCSADVLLASAPVPVTPSEKIV
jgi:hypothetical protein